MRRVQLGVHARRTAAAATVYYALNDRNNGFRGFPYTVHYLHALHTIPSFGLAPLQ